MIPAFLLTIQINQYCIMAEMVFDICMSLDSKLQTAVITSCQKISRRRKCVLVNLPNHLYEEI